MPLIQLQANRYDYHIGKTWIFDCSALGGEVPIDFIRVYRKEVIPVAVRFWNGLTLKAEGRITRIGRIVEFSPIGDVENSYVASNELDKWKIYSAEPMHNGN